MEGLSRTTFNIFHCIRASHSEVSFVRIMLAKVYLMLASMLLATSALRTPLRTNTIFRKSSLQAIPDISPIVLAQSPLESYVYFWVDLYKQLDLSVPEPLIHWGHGAAMSTVLIAMGGIGTFLGYQIRNGNGAAEYAFTLGKTAREQHPLIMGLATFFFLLGGQGGLVLLALEGKPILESPHAVTAGLGLSLLAAQALLPTLFKGETNKTARTAHTVLGTSTMALLVVHGILGLNLGLSF